VTISTGSSARETGSSAPLTPLPGGLSASSEACGKRDTIRNRNAHGRVAVLSTGLGATAQTESGEATKRLWLVWASISSKQVGIPARVGPGSSAPPLGAQALEFKSVIEAITVTDGLDMARFEIFERCSLPWRWSD